MSTVCRIGVKYIAEKMDEQQQRLDQALTASVQANPKAKAKNSDIGSSTSIWISATSILVSLASLLATILK